MIKSIEEVWLPLKDIKPNPNNPRYITEPKLEKLVKSIQEFPEMITIRPLVVNQDNLLLGGNMRYRALRKLGFNEVKVIKVYGITTEQEKEFLIKDNIGYGEWNWETLLTDEWNLNQLQDWALDVPEWLDHTEILEMDHSDFDADFQPSESNTKTITLKYSLQDYTRVMQGLDIIDENPSQAVLTLILNQIDGTN